MLNSMFRSIGTTSSLMCRESLEETDRFLLLFATVGAVPLGRDGFHRVLRRCRWAEPSCRRFVPLLGSGTHRGASICFSLCNRASGPEIVDWGSLHGPLRPQPRLEQGGVGSPPHLFQWVLR